MMKSRICSLYSYLSGISDQSLIYFPPREKLDNLFYPQTQGTFSRLTQFSQNSSFLVDFLISDLKTFAQCVIGRSSCPDFEHIVHAVIPSIFGYFSCLEHLKNAFLFYESVVELAPPQLAVQIIEPFFNSVCTFRFLEHALDNFFYHSSLIMLLLPKNIEPNCFPVIVITYSNVL